jgi:hypothetical protein
MRVARVRDATDARRVRAPVRARNPATRDNRMVRGPPSRAAHPTARIGTQFVRPCCRASTIFTSVERVSSPVALGREKPHGSTDAARPRAAAEDPNGNEVDPA